MSNAGAQPGALDAALARLAPQMVEGAERIEGLVRLTAGATNETWRFDAVARGMRTGLVLRRSIMGRVEGGSAIPLGDEAALIDAANRAGAPAPRVAYVLRPEDGLGEGFVMARIEGETIARKVLRDAAFAEARPHLARQAGQALARIHAVAPAQLPPLPIITGRTRLERFRVALDAVSAPKPVFELALRWLAERVGPEPENLRLIHGDFRHGNLMIDQRGLAAVLDWELAHLGDIHEDLAWISVTPWRFGEIEKPVGGFGARADLFAGYEAAGGGAIDPVRVHWWEVLGSLNWGLMCAAMAEAYRSGADTSLERPMIARRASENEVDLLRLLTFGE